MIFFSVVFVLLFRFNAYFVCKLIRKQCIKSVQFACKPTFMLLFLCFFCISLYSPLKIILKQLFASGSVNHGEYSPRLRLGEYSP